MLKLQLKSVEKANKEFCGKSGGKRSDFMKWSKCGNSAKPETVKCWKSFVGDVGRISKIKKGPEMQGNLFGLLCCKCHESMKCMTDAWKADSENCSDDAIQGFQELALKTSQDSLNLVCSKVPPNERDNICKDLNEKYLKTIAPLDKLPLTAIQFMFQILT